MTDYPAELDDLTAQSRLMFQQVLNAEADPEFIRRLRLDLRASHARLHRRLGRLEFDIPVGRLHIVHDGELVHLVSNDSVHLDQQLDQHFGFEPRAIDSEKLRRRIASVFAGRRRGSEIAYLGELGAFQQAVLRTAATIPRGEVRPYGWVARQAGAAGAVRAAGTSLGHNPTPFIVPCHRVVKSDWQLGQYSAGGTAVKDRILRWEGLDVDRLHQIASGRVRFCGRRGGKTFCLPACRSILRLPADELVVFRTAEEAAARGYSPCSHCCPA